MSEYAYLTTVGRRSGRPHTIEIWYAEHGDDVFLISGGPKRADWVRNLRREPKVSIRFGGPRVLRADVEGTVDATAQVVSDPAQDALARRLLAAKYQGWREGQPLSEWARTGLPIVLRRADQGWTRHRT